MQKRSETISPTAHYTGYTWYQHGLSHPALVTPQGRVLHTMVGPLNALARVTGAPTLSGLLLARHHSIDHLLQGAIDDGRITQVIEVAAGLSPRGWRFKQRYGDRLRYVEADLPDMARLKRDRLARSGLQSPGHEVVALDAMTDTGPLSLSALADTLDVHQGTAIITEGLVNYFDQAALLGMWARFAQVLARFPHSLYLSDIHLSSTGDRMAVKGFLAVLSTFVRGRVHLHFESAGEACAALRQAGFEHATLHEPRMLSSAAGFTPCAGADLVRIIEARGQHT